MEIQESKYYAFISYSHKDAKWAEWILRKLTFYRLPSYARKEIGRDIRIHPICKDDNTLPPGPLRELLHQKLSESKFLIVICSPNSAKPNIKNEHWVDEEVRYFIDSGRLDHIIPVIVDGEPDSGDRECFCPALRKSGLLAIDATKNRRQKVLNFTVAKLLGLNPEMLEDYALNESRKQFRLRFYCILPLLILAAAAGYFLYDSSRTVVNHYADYADSYGLPKGIFPLTAQQIRKRNLHYRFEYRGYRFGETIHADSSPKSPFRWLGFRRVLRRVVQAGSAGTPKKYDHTEYADRPMIQKFLYDETGRLKEKQYCRIGGKDGSGLVEKRLLFFNESGIVNGLIKFYGEGSNRIMQFSGASVTLASPDKQIEKSSIAMHIVTRDSSGRPLSVRFCNSSGAPARDADGIFGFQYLLDDHGRISELWYLDHEGKRQPNKLGVAGKKYFYRGRNMVRGEYVDASGKPTMNHLGWMVAVDEFDSNDNTIASSYYNAIGELTLHKDGYVKATMKYDDRGNRIEEAYYGIDGKPCLHKDGNAVWRGKYDARGNRIETSYYGIDGKPCLNNDGYAKVTMKYDDRGNQIKSSYYGIDGKPCLHKDGNAVWFVKYDARGNRIESAYFGTDGEPCLIKDGYTVWRGRYDARGNRIESAYFGTDGKPCLIKDGYAVWRGRYDARGNRIEEAYFRTDGKPCLIKNGYAVLRTQYDDRGNQIEEAYYGIDGKPCLSKNGFAKTTVKYDEHRKISDISFFGVDGTSYFFLFFCNSVLPNSPAATLGVHVGDVWVSLNQVDCLNIVNVIQLQHIMPRLSNLKKTLTVARKENGVYRLLKFEFQPGAMGIGFGSKFVSTEEKEAIMKAVSKKN